MSRIVFFGGGGAVFDTLPYMLKIKISVRVRYERTIRPSIFATANLRRRFEDSPTRKKPHTWWDSFLGSGGRTSARGGQASRPPYEQNKSPSFDGHLFW